MKLRSIETALKEQEGIPIWLLAVPAGEYTLEDLSKLTFKHKTTILRYVKIYCNYRYVSRPPARRFACLYDWEAIDFKVIQEYVRKVYLLDLEKIDQLNEFLPKENLQYV